MSAANLRPDLVARAQTAWGTPPDWVLELAKLAMATSQTFAAKTIGYSPSVVNQVIGRTYQGDFGNVEQRVRGAILKETVACPVFGEMTRHNCLDWQKKSPAATSGLRMKMYRACRSGCPHSRLPKEY